MGFSEKRLWGLVKNGFYFWIQRCSCNLGLTFHLKMAIFELKIDLSPFQPTITANYVHFYLRSEENYPGKNLRPPPKIELPEYSKTLKNHMYGKNL